MVAPPQGASPDIHFGELTSCFRARGGLPLRYVRDLHPLTAIPLDAIFASLHTPLRGTPRCALRTVLPQLHLGPPPASCPPFVLQRGYPRERISSGSGVRLPVRASVLRHPRHKEGSAESPQEGGRSEVKRSRAGSSHGEPRTEPRPPRRRSRVSDTSRALAGGIFSLIP
jgi:hypothetical protein